MEKFLSIPVTNEQSQLVAASGVILVEQASTTTVTIAYNARVTTITHAALGAGVETMRDQIQAAIVAALQQPWHQVTRAITPVAAVSAIATA